MDSDNDPSFLDTFHPFLTPEPELSAVGNKLPQLELSFPATTRTIEDSESRKEKKAKMEEEQAAERKRIWDPINEELRSINEKVRECDEIIKNVGPTVEEYENAIKESATIFLRRNEILKIIEESSSFPERNEALTMFHKIRKQDEGSTVGRLVTLCDPSNPHLQLIERKIRFEKEKLRFSEEMARNMLWAAHCTMRDMAEKHDKRQKKKQAKLKVRISDKEPEIIILSDSPGPSFS